VDSPETSINSIGYRVRHPETGARTLGMIKQGMPELMNAAGERRLVGFFDKIGAVLGRRERRESFAIYARGILGDGDRKSIEPIAARACADPDLADAAHQRLLHFAADSPWSDRAVRREASRYAIDAMKAAGPIDSWIIDDTGLLKQGTHSVGVQRQYTGSAGKVTNCQIAGSLSIANSTEHLPIDFALYLPTSWTRVDAVLISGSGRAADLGSMGRCVSRPDMVPTFG
jgi:SRSO17 transposase